MNTNSWVCGLLIANTNGGGNGVFYIDIMSAGTYGATTIAINQGNVTAIEGTFSGSTLILTAKNKNTSVALRFDRAVWIGIGQL